MKTKQLVVTFSIILFLVGMILPVTAVMAAEKFTLKYWNHPPETAWQSQVSKRYIADVKEKIRPLEEKMRDEVTGKIEEALQLAESWVPAVREVCQEVGIPTPSYFPGTLFIRDFESRLKDRFRKLYQ